MSQGQVEKLSRQAWTRFPWDWEEVVYWKDEVLDLEEPLDHHAMRD